MTTPSTPTHNHTFGQRLLNGIEAVGNKVPHPVLLFLILIIIVVIASAVLQLFDASATFERINTDTHQVETQTQPVRSLLSGEGVRFMFSSLVPNFLGFVALGQLVAAMLGVGVAEESGMINAMIRKLVSVAPRWILCYFIVFVGIQSSIASNAGYLVLIPLAAVAFRSVGRHPLAGLAAGFAAVGGAFSINIFITPTDAVLVELTNDAIHIIDPTASIKLTSNVWFNIASSLFLTVIITLVTERIIEPRLGKYTGTEQADKPADAKADAKAKDGAANTPSPADEARGLRYALFALLGVTALICLLTLPPGAPLRDPATGQIIGNTPFMDGLIAMIMLVFLAMGTAFGFGAGTFKDIGDVIKAMHKTVVGLSGMIMMLFFISQFVAYFNFSRIPTFLAISMSDTLEGMNVGPFFLLIGFIIVIAIFNIFMTGAIGKWAMLAPVFVPLLMRLGVDPEVVLAAYRVGDSPTNTATPMLSMFALILGFFQKYDKNAGIGTVFSTMIPLVLCMLISWTLFFSAWYWLGIPFGF
ncbi:MAG: AbgT family transporter [Phycisphaeraceae bacterium]|jgi:aminobenzoyl-glutamate transport protein|nr:AbgT family transporter [Phycisphaeraceae bacterium]